MTENNTLNKDINLIERDCGYWDYEFQYGDIVQSKNNQSLRNGLIIACLTSWNYLNRQGNPTYSEFGNKAYWELKKKKSTMVEYTIKQYFIEVLNRIRRVNRVISIEVVDTPTDPNSYDVHFTVEAINDEIVKGQFPITTTTGLGTTYMEVQQHDTTTTPIRQAEFTITLNTEYNTTLEDELIYIYIKEDETTTRFLKAIKTGENGTVQVTIPPQNHIAYDEIMFQYRGNTEYNGCTSETYKLLSKPFYFTVTPDSRLNLYKNKDYELTCWLGEIITDTAMADLTDTTKNYIIQDGQNYTKMYHDGIEWVTSAEDVYSMINPPEDLQVGDIRLYIEDTEYQLYVVTDIKIEQDSTLEMYKDHIVYEI